MTSDDRPVLRLGHSPDPDDAVMWWPLASLDDNPPALDTGRFRYELVARDIEALNRLAPSGDLEITAMSCACYPHVQDTYAITACGASLGDAYGPKLVARAPACSRYAASRGRQGGRRVKVAHTGARSSIGMSGRSLSE